QHRRLGKKNCRYFAANYMSAPKPRQTADERRARQAPKSALAVRVPAVVPVEVFQAGEIFLVVVDERLAVGVAGIVIAVALAAREFDRLENHQNAGTAPGFGRIEDRVHGGSRRLAEIEKGHAEQLFREVNAKLDVAAGNRCGIGREKIVERGGRVVAKALPVAQKELGFFRVDKRRPHADFGVAIFGEHALLAARGDETLQIDAQRHDRESSAVVKGVRIAEKQNAEVAPALGPIAIHGGGRRLRAEKTLVPIEAGHGSIMAKRASTALDRVQQSGRIISRSSSSGSFRYGPILAVSVKPRRR